jgi:16S rRNA (guanine527-N7)-methyltransferase
VDVLDRWLEAVLATPGLTALRDPAEARRVLLDDALRAVPHVAAESGPVVDVGSGGGTPGIPLAAALLDREVTLLEAEQRKCDFLETWTAELPNLRVVWGRAEEQSIEQFGVAVA